MHSDSNAFEDTLAIEQTGVEPKYTHVPRFEPNSPEAQTYLDQHGYVVIADVLGGKKNVDRAVSLTWSYLESLGTGIKRDDPATWADEKWPTVVHGGILPAHGIGQSAAQWFIRSQPRVKAAFSSIWKTDELLTSFDGMSVWRPWYANEKWRTTQVG